MGTVPSRRTPFQKRRTTVSSCRSNGRHSRSCPACDAIADDDEVAASCPLAVLVVVVVETGVEVGEEVEPEDEDEAAVAEELRWAATQSCSPWSTASRSL